MRVIAGIMAHVLRATQPGATDAGAPSRAQFSLDPDVAERARLEVAELLQSYPLYPEIDLDFVQSAAM